MSRKICYISGGMSGLPDYNFPAFNDCAAKLRADGWHVFNPAENFDGRTDLARNVYMTADFKHLLSVADDPGFETRGIVMLPGWSGSQGARVEVAMALEMGLSCYFWQGDKLHETTAESVKAFLNAGFAGIALGTKRDEPTSEVRITDPKTGGQKGAKNIQFHTIPPEFLAEVGRVYSMGAKKYSARNFEKGYAWSLSFDAMMRHLWAWWGGEETDPESGCNHMAHGIWHCFQLMLLAKYHRDLDDRSDLYAKGRNIPQDSQG